VNRYFRPLRQTIPGIAVAVLLFALSAADVPRVISYQGRLTDSLGEAVRDGSHQVQFKIWTTSEGPGFELWDSGVQDVETVDGLFTYLLGSNVPFSANLFSADTNRWLGIAVDGDPEGIPRAKLTSQPFAFHARRADSAGYAARADTADYAAAAPPLRVIWERKTVGGNTEMIGPDAGTMEIAFDSVFTTIPLVSVIVVTRVNCGSLESRSVPYWEISTELDGLTLKVWDCAGGSVLAGCSLEITYTALQIGP